MPELAEVERGRRLAEETARGRRVVKAICARDAIVYDGVPPDCFRKAMVGRTVRSVGRHGKHLWFELDRRPWPLFHFGMTGAFRTPGETPIWLVSSGKRSRAEWPPRFQKLRLVFDDGGELAFTNARRLGRIRMREDLYSEPPLSRLGFDPLLDLPTPREFAELVEKRATRLKALLLDQSFAAGVGNWIADEVLYRARLDPRRRTSTLSREEIGRMRTALKSIVATAVAKNADSSRFPKGWLFHRRWRKGRNSAEGPRERIEWMVVAGRTTAWVPSRQS